MRRARSYSIFNFFKDKPKIEFPWQLSSIENKPLPAVMDTIKQAHYRNLGITRARKLLKDDAYNFPKQFNLDSAKVFVDTLDALPTNESKLKDLMTMELYELYAKGLSRLASKKETISFEFHSEPKVRVNKLHFYYGPSPIPENYITQNWLDLISITLPQEDAVFESHGRQSELMQRAEKEGCYFRIDTTIDVDLEFTLFNENGLPLIRDCRSFVDVEFTSPHFTPFDEIFDLQEDGTWKLGFPWRIVDIDRVFAQSQINKEA